MFERERKIAYLKQYRESLNRYLSLIAERNEWLAIGFAASGGADPPVKSSSKMPSKVPLAVEQRDALLVQLNRELAQCKAKRAEIVALIENIEREEQQQVLRLVYVNGFSWEIVAATMGYSVRQARRLHDKAIDDLYIVI